MIEEDDFEYNPGDEKIKPGMDYVHAVVKRKTKNPWKISGYIVSMFFMLFHPKALKAFTAWVQTMKFYKYKIDFIYKPTPKKEKQSFMLEKISLGAVVVYFLSMLVFIFGLGALIFGDSKIAYYLVMQFCFISTVILLPIMLAFFNELVKM